MAKSRRRSRYRFNFQWNCRCLNYKIAFISKQEPNFCHLKTTNFGDKKETLNRENLKPVVFSVLPLFDQGSFAYINHAIKRQDGITRGN